MKKGDIVKINMTAKSIRAHTPDGIQKRIQKYSMKSNLTGIVLGYSFLKIGKIIEGNYYDPNYLKVDKTHKVFIVEPLQSYKPYSPNGEQWMNNNRFLEPVRCFEDDLELIE